MLMKDSNKVSNQYPNFYVVQICLTPGLLGTRSKVIKYKFVKKSNKIIEIITTKSDKKTARTW